MQALRLHGKLDDEVNFVRITKKYSLARFTYADIVVSALAADTKQSHSKKPLLLHFT